MNTSVSKYLVHAKNIAHLLKIYIYKHWYEQTQMLSKRERKNSHIMYFSQHFIRFRQTLFNGIGFFHDCTICSF